MRRFVGVPSDAAIVSGNFGTAFSASAAFARSSPSFVRTVSANADSGIAEGAQGPASGLSGAEAFVSMVKTDSTSADGFFPIAFKSAAASNTSA